MKPLIFPPRSNGEPAPEMAPETRSLVIIGANGAGKTRFTRRMAADAPAGSSVWFSALNALYPSATATSAATSPIEPSELPLDALLSRLMHDEVLNLIAYKLDRADNPAAVLATSRLDVVIDGWQEVFPDNRVLIESGRMLFGRGDDLTAYSSLRLSNGEKAVLYYLAALSYVPQGGIVFVDAPEVFLHPSLTATLWDRIEAMRPDCRFVYTTHDLEFAGSRREALKVWVRDCNVAEHTWSYELLGRDSGIPDQVYLAILGSRKPVLFIEGDGEHSIDAKLYPLIFKDYTIKSLGSCNKVIETTRTFNDMGAFHHLDSHGIVDRDRRDEHEVAYLRRKKVFVPDVAEIENILMLEDVVRTVAAENGRDPDAVFGRVSHTIIALFRGNLHQQALQHTRHRMKRFMEYRIDGRFTDIGMLERHLDQLTQELNARGLYDSYCRDFHRYADTADYAAVLKVFNQKTMVGASNVAQLCGLVGGQQAYVDCILRILRADGEAAQTIRAAVLRCFGVGDAGTDMPQQAESAQTATFSRKPFSRKKKKHRRNHDC